MRKKPTIWLSREDYARCTAEDFERFNIGIDLTRGGVWRSYDPQFDYENEADAHGKPMNDFMRGPR